MEKLNKSEEEWRSILDEETYHITRQKGTERPFTGKYLNNHEEGTYLCTCCSFPLFSSGTKFDSGSGWPSFYKPIENKHVGMNTDKSHGMIRTEIVCNRCGAHLGHVFTDGPEPTGLRYCVNSVSLEFKKKEND